MRTCAERERVKERKRERERLVWLSLAIVHKQLLDLQAFKVFDTFRDKFGRWAYPKTRVTAAASVTKHTKTWEIITRAAPNDMELITNSCQKRQ